MTDLTMIDTNAWQASTTSSYDFKFLSSTGDTVITQIAQGMPVWNDPLLGEGLRNYSVTGVVRQYDVEAPLLEGHYLLPRFTSDFEEAILISTKEINNFDLSVIRFGESLQVEAPSAIASVKLVGLNGQVLRTSTFLGGQTSINLEVASSTTPLQVLWVELADGRNKAVFVR